MSEPQFTGELVGGPCGTTNAQAALIAASVSCAKYSDGGLVTEVAEVYLTWLQHQDAKAEAKAWADGLTDE